MSGLSAAGSYDEIGGFVADKVEGRAVLSDGTALAVNGNDGGEGSSGEAMVVRIPQLLQ